MYLWLLFVLIYWTDQVCRTYNSFDPKLSYQVSDSKWWCYFRPSSRVSLLNWKIKLHLDNYKVSSHEISRIIPFIIPLTNLSNLVYIYVYFECVCVCQFIENFDCYVLDKCFGLVDTPLDSTELYKVRLKHVIYNKLLLRYIDF